MEGEGEGTCYRVISCVIWTDVAVAVAIETRHGFFTEEAEWFLHDFLASAM
jgi:hypothetical protein